MKVTNMILAGLTGLALSFGAAQANDINDPAQFSGSGAVAHSVKDVGVREVPFELVELDGNLIEAIGGEDYIFQDSTGQIVVHIPEELMLGKVISSNTPVKVQGEVHRDAAQPKSVDVFVVDTAD